MKPKNIWKKAWGAVLALTMSAGLLAGCGSSGEEDSQDRSQSESSSGEKVFYYGDTTFNAENDESDVNPHNGYSGWACIRYGIGETLFRYSDTMELEPWLATEYENVDENTWRITLRDGVTFTSGRELDAQAVKECLEHLVEVHERAKGNLNPGDHSRRDDSDYQDYGAGTGPDELSGRSLRLHY